MTKHPDEIMAAGIIAAARVGEEMTPPPCADHQVNELGCQVCSAQRRAFYAALGQPEKANTMTPSDSANALTDRLVEVLADVGPIIRQMPGWHAEEVASTSNKSLDSTGSVVVTVLERVWAALRAEHPELPEVVIVTGSAYVGPPRWGHHRPAGWIDRAGAEEEATTLRLGEMFVAGESLAKGARFTLETMLHEATHVLAKARGISDTSRQGRWHNAKFKTLAEELGMVYSGTQADKKLGFSEVFMTEATATKYAALLDDLDRAIRLVIDVPAFLRGEEDGAAGDRAPAKPTAKSKPRFLKLVCSCEEPRTIRVSVSSGADGIRCQECDEDFELAE